MQVTYLMLRYTVRFRYMRDELEGRGANQEDIDSVTGGQFGYLMLLLVITTGASGIVYFTIPLFTDFAADALSNIPVPHMVLGLLVVVVISSTLVYYLRSQED